jgi:hypothetical protein
LTTRIYWIISYVQEIKRSPRPMNYPWAAVCGACSLFLLLSCTTIPRGPSVRPMDSVAREYYAEAVENLEGGDIARALLLLYTARERSPRDRDIRAEIERVVSSLEPEAVYRKELIRKGKGLESPLQYILTYGTGDERVPVFDMPVSFTFIQGSGLLTEEAVTDDLGIAKCYVEDIRDFSDLVIIEAGVVLQAGGARIEPESLKRQFVFRDVSILDLPHLVLVRIVDPDPSSAAEAAVPLPADLNLCGTASEPFYRNGFSRLSCAPADDPRIFDRAFSMDRSALALLKNQRNTGMFVLIRLTPAFFQQQSADFFLYQTAAEMKIIDAESFSLQFETSSREKGAGRTAREALDRSLVRSVEGLNERVDEYIARTRRKDGI